MKKSIAKFIEEMWKVIEDEKARNAIVDLFNDRGVEMDMSFLKMLRWAVSGAIDEKLGIDCGSGTSKKEVLRIENPREFFGEENCERIRTELEPDFVSRNDEDGVDMYHPDTLIVSLGIDGPAAALLAAYDYIEIKR